MLENIRTYWEILGSDKGRAERAPSIDALGNVRNYWEMLENTGKCWEILGSDKGRAERAPYTDARAAERSEAANASPI